MTPKEKAKYLFDIFEPLVFNPEDTEAVCDSKAKECALICVEEIISDNLVMNRDLSEEIRNSFWNEVKQEINKN
jgi:hypothetical protein